MTKLHRLPPVQQRLQRARLCSFLFGSVVGTVGRLSAFVNQISGQVLRARNIRWNQQLGRIRIGSRRLSPGLLLGLSPYISRLLSCDMNLPLSSPTFCQAHLHLPSRSCICSPLVLLGSTVCRSLFRLFSKASSVHGL